MYWTTEEILKFAPDQASIKKAREVSIRSKWMSLVSNGQIVWGAFHTGGKKPYNTVVDLETPAFKCSCPSRKFPCKHALGLFLLSITDTDGFRISSDLPEWVETWIENRGKRKKTKETKGKTPEEIQRSKEAKEKTRKKRLETMKSGLKDLELWLEDLTREGLATVQSNSRKDKTFWSDIASRMVDSKMRGVATRIRELELISSAQKEWHESMLMTLSDLHLITKGVKAFDNIPDTLQIELLNQLGVTVKQSDLLEENGIKDNWLIIGQFESYNIDNAPFQRTWFLGEKTGKFGFYQEYDYRKIGFQYIWNVGSVIEAEAVFYPSSYPLRLIFKSQKIVHIIDDSSFQGTYGFSTYLEQYSQALSDNPWLREFPCYIHSVIPIVENDIFYIVDENSNKIPLEIRGNLGWKIMSLSQGQKVDVFGEWFENSLMVLSIKKGERRVFFTNHS